VRRLVGRFQVLSCKTYLDCSRVRAHRRVDEWDRFSRKSLRDVLSVLCRFSKRLDGCEKVVVGFVGVVFDELKVELKGRYDISK